MFVTNAKIVLSSKTYFVKIVVCYFSICFFLRATCPLSSRFSSAFEKLLKSKRISMRMIKQICVLLRKQDLVESSWLLKPIERLVANSVDLGLMISVTINGQTVCCILDTGSTFSLVPHKIWKSLKINPSLLDCSVTYNINSASHRVSDAVIGRISLPFQITNSNGEAQFVMEDSLILLKHLDLQYILLGNDFTKSNSVSISFTPDSKSVLINDQKVEMLEPCSPSQKVDIFSAISKKNLFSLQECDTCFI